MKKLKEKEISSKTIFKGNFLTVKQDSVLLPNGEIGTREWIKHPGAACCVPILPNGDIVLIKQYRYSLKREMIELPAGKRNKNESFEECARRELEEEIGYKQTSLLF
jgi:ADP-ribose pyrophosphatase